MSLSELIGTTGVTLLLLAFALNLMDRLAANDKSYLFLNFLGAALACMSSYLIAFWPFVVLEGVWSVSSLIGLVKSMRNAN